MGTILLVQHEDGAGVMVRRILGREEYTWTLEHPPNVAASADGIVAKPFAPATLLGAVSQALGAGEGEG